MGAPASETLRELERELTIVTDQGRTATRGDLQESLGVGGAELQEMLDTLREHGKAIEDSPGEWRGPMADEIPAPDVAIGADGRVRVSGDTPEEPDDDERTKAEFDELATMPLAPLPPWAPATVKLTPAVVEALDAEALGQLVKAAITEAQERDEPFTLEVSS